MLAAGCDPRPLDELGEIYYRWDDRKVLCAAGLDTVSNNSTESVLGAMDRALAEDSVVLFFTHDPGGTVPIDKLDAILGHAAAIGLPPVRFADLAAGGPPRAGYSLSFDDAHVDDWYDLRPLLDQHGARVTFFVTRYPGMSAARKAKLVELAADGHDVQAHTVEHLRAPAYVEEHGLDAWLADEALPSIDLLRADGHDVVAFAYPFGARTSELDAALLEHVALVRSVSFSAGAPLVADPCPE